MTLQYREAVGTETRSYDDGLRQVEAKVCSYGVGPDTYGTTWSPGWAREALEKSLPAVCWGHDQRDVVGSVIGFRDEPDGLYVTMQFADPEDVPSARRAFSLIRDGHVKGYSFGFSGAKGKPDPQFRGATQFTSGVIHEVSPVVRPSVPLTRTVSVRAADDTVTDVDETALAPHLAQAFAEALSEGARSLTISIGDDGTVSTTGNPASVGSLDLNDDGSDGSDATDSPEALAGAVDAALDEACSLLDGVDTTQLPDPVQQALALVVAASTTVDELLDAMGVPDPDEYDTERAAAPTTPAAPKAGDSVTITGGKGTGKTGKITRIMPNGVLLVDVGGSAPVMVSPKNAKPAKPASARAADEPDETSTHPEDPEIRAALDDLERLHHTR